MLLACTQTSQDIASIPIPSEDDNIESESFGVEYLYSDSARVTARLEAPHVIEKKEKLEETDEEGEETVHYFDQGLLITFYSAGGRQSGTVSANRGHLLKEKGIAELKGNVVLIKLDYRGQVEKKLETEQLFWDQEKDSIYNHDYVRITTPDKIIIGHEGFKTNTAFDPFQVFGIQGEFEVEEEESP